MDNYYLGQVFLMAISFAPRNFSYCAGQLITIASNNALFALLGTEFGGDGRVTFGLPDLRGRTPVGSNQMGNGPGLTTFRTGTKYGAQTHTMTVSQMPSHNHTATFTHTGGGSVTGKLEAYAKGASSGTPTAGDFISGNTSTIFGTGGGIGNELVELSGLTISGGGAVSGVVSVNDNGSSHAFEIMNPVQAMPFIICTEGLFPSRN